MFDYELIIESESCVVELTIKHNIEDNEYVFISSHLNKDMGRKIDTLWGTLSNTVDKNTYYKVKSQAIKYLKDKYKYLNEGKNDAT